MRRASRTGARHKKRGLKIQAALFVFLYHPVLHRSGKHPRKKTLRNGLLLSAANTGICPHPPYGTFPKHT